jgi:hypothetical protein
LIAARDHHDDAVVREHADWALQQFHGALAPSHA